MNGLYIPNPIVTVKNLGNSHHASIVGGLNYQKNFMDNEAAEFPLALPHMLTRSDT